LLAPTSYVVVAKAPGAAFDAQYGTGGAMVLGPYSGNLANDGESIEVKPAGGSTNLIACTFSDVRGWPLSADGAGHALVPTVWGDQGDGRLDHPLGWRASAHIHGSAGRSDPAPFDGLLINEVAAHFSSGV